MENKLSEQASKILSDNRVKLISKQYLIDEIKDKMSGLDKAKNYNRWKALSECLTMVEDAKELN